MNVAQDIDIGSPDELQNERQQARVVLIHGTFASSADDSGNAWWQVGSSAYQELQDRLPSDVSLANDGQVFRWSGENNERARSKAASELLDYLAPLEKEGRPYHLMGHSHGGSVIWVALLLATTRRRPLKHLKSWSTIGTPFFRHRTRSPWNVLSILYMFLAATLLLPAGRAFWALASMPHKIANGGMANGLVVKSDAEAGLVVSVIRAPVLKIMEWSGVSMVDTPDGLRLGSFDPNSGQSFSEFLFQTTEGWLILAGIILFGYITLLLGSWFIRPVLASLRIRFENRAERKAMHCYASRWLGIWSRDDEAINGLRATLDLSISFVGRLVPRERIYFSDSISLLSRPYFWLFAPVYNTVFRPVIDRLIRGVVVRTAQGNNRPSAVVIDVAPCPLTPPDAPVIPPLPAALESRILADADRYAKDLGPKLRDLISQPSFVSSLEKFGEKLSGRELVHTSYFDHPEIIGLLAMNVRWSIDNATVTQTRNMSGEVVDWFFDYKRLLARYSVQDAQLPSSMPMPVVEPDVVDSRTAA